MTDSNARYVRQRLVPPLSGDAQDKIGSARVLIVGAGGLGSPVSLFLAGAGIGKLTIIDPDVVSISNLHRQILFQENDVNASKADTAKARLSALNSQIDIESVNGKLSADNAMQLVNRADVVVDAADNFLASYLLSDVCLKTRTPLVSASVLTTHGYLGVFCGTQGSPAPSLRAVFPTPSAQANNCNTAGVTGPSVGVIGSYQAQEVLKAITQDKTQLLGKLMSLDLWDYRQHIIDFNKAPEPKSSAPIVALDSLNAHSESAILLDVRSAQEHHNEPMPRPAINIPLSELATRFNELDPEQAISCICKTGQRALNAAQLLLNNGFQKVTVTSR